MTEAKNNLHKIYSNKLKLYFNVHIQDDELSAHQPCIIMTVHDLGCDHTSFEEFITCPEMRGLKERIKWIHVDLPGQEPDAADLEMKKYPTIIEIAYELIIILDHLKIGQVVCLGEGAGANIVARFAMAHSSRCLGLCLIHPSGSTASISETFNNKIVNVIKCFPKSSLTKSQVSYLIWHRYGNSAGDLELVNSNIREFQTNLENRRNSKNLSLFIDSYLNRTNITEKMDELKVDVLIAVGEKASLSSETKKFYKCLYDSRKNDRKKLVNCSVLEVKEIGDILGESPDKLTIALQFFLQGVGLLPAMPMKKELIGLGRLSRAFSMLDPVLPRMKNELRSESNF